jgi:FtsP/CotA-like multicopper oxidase with cupredoxin domain
MAIDTLYVPPVEWNETMPMMNWLSTGMEVTWILPDAAVMEDGQELRPAMGWRFTEGDVVKIRLFNDPKSLHPMNHPMHLHGQRFLVLEQDGVRLNDLVWRDTVLVPVGSTVDILVEMSNPGMWMFNCQIPEHVGTGMSISFRVDPAP